MEKINELLENFGDVLKKDVNLESLNEYTKTVDSLNTVISDISAKKEQIVRKLEGKATGVSIEEYVKNTDAEIGSLTEKFALYLEDKHYFLNNIYIIL